MPDYNYGIFSLITINNKLTLSCPDCLKNKGNKQIREICAKNLCLLGA